MMISLGHYGHLYTLFSIFLYHSSDIDIGYDSDSKLYFKQGQTRITELVDTRLIEFAYVRQANKY